MYGLYLQVAAEIFGKKGVRELCGNFGGNVVNQNGEIGGGAVDITQLKYFARSALLRTNGGKNVGG